MQSKSIIISVIALFPLLASAQQIVGPGKAVDPYRFSAIKSQTYARGAVASAHPIASRVGGEILKRGGNSFDAVIATQLALAVVYPGAGNIGGGGFLVAKTKGGKTFTLDYRETAPAKANRDMYLDESGNANTNLSQFGHLASGIPGTVSGIFKTLKYASLPFSTLIQPAIDLAENGFTLTAAEAAKFTNTQAAFKKYNTVAPVFVKEGGWKTGDTLVQKELAKTLSRIRDKGLAGFYEGETARLIV
jgi:gamma-glutamyltranspeptidase/glutathione hydrolase